jgi:hypothetical protein
MPEKLEEPFNTTLTFYRTYYIDIDHISMQEFSWEFMYSSLFSKQIELIPGEKLILVFPPDTPSVHGFDIEDTLILRP